MSPKRPQLDGDEEGDFDDFDGDGGFFEAEDYEPDLDDDEDPDDRTDGEED